MSAADAGVTSPAECYRIYLRQRSVRPYGAYRRTWALTVGYSYQNLCRMIKSLQRAEGRQWEPVLYPVTTYDDTEEYRCPLPNEVAIAVKRRYYTRGIITDSWWHLHWPTNLDPADPCRAINLIHQIDTLKQARALIGEYVTNGYITPEGACAL